VADFVNGQAFHASFFFASVEGDFRGADIADLGGGGPRGVELVAVEFHLRLTLSSSL
jgi:hypothetical protein